MTNISTFAVCALCAVPALVQPVSAQESAKVQAFGELMGSAMDLTGTFFGAIQAVENEEASAAEAAAAINELAVKAAEVRGAMKAAMASMTPEELKELGEIMQDPEVAQMMKDLSDTMTAVKAKLEEVKHYDSPELKAACDKFFAATE